MTVDKSWQLGQPGSLPYRLFDALRKGLNRRLVMFLADHALQTPGRRVLEAGSGPAFASSMLREQSNVQLSVAADIDIEALREARLRDPQLCVVVADLYHLPFRDESFDLVWNSSTLEHFDHREDALQELVRTTRAGQYVFVGVPFLYGPLGFQRWIANTGVGIWIGTVFSRDKLHTFLQSARLVPQQTITYFLRFFVGTLARKP